MVEAVEVIEEMFLYGHCNKGGHSCDTYYSLHGFPPKIANVTQIEVSSVDHILPTGLSTIVISTEEYARFLQSQIT